MTFQEWYKSKKNKNLMAKYRTCLINYYGGEEIDITTQQDDWSYDIFNQKVTDGALSDYIAEEIAMEIKQLESLMKIRIRKALKRK
jgi:hypothetical protein